MESIKHLDNILFILKAYPNEQTPTNVYDAIKNLSPPIDEVYVEPALKKLVKDGYAEVKEYSIPDKDDPTEMWLVNYYKISFEGLTLLETGGYAKKYADETREANRIKKQDEQIRLLTLFLAIGSIGVLIIEALKFILDYF